MHGVLADSRSPRLQLRLGSGPASKSPKHFFHSSFIHSSLFLPAVENRRSLWERGQEIWWSERISVEAKPGKEQGRKMLSAWPLPTCARAQAHSCWRVKSSRAGRVVEIRGRVGRERNSGPSFPNSVLSHWSHFL